MSAWRLQRRPEANAALKLLTRTNSGGCSSSEAGSSEAPIFLRRHGYVTLTGRTCSKMSRR